MNNLETAKERLAAAFEKLETKLLERKNFYNTKEEMLNHELEDYQKIEATANEVVSDLNTSIAEIENLLKKRHGNS